MDDELRERWMSSLRLNLSLAAVDDQTGEIMAIRFYGIIYPLLLKI